MPKCLNDVVTTTHVIIVGTTEWVTLGGVGESLLDFPNPFTRCYHPNFDHHVTVKLEGKFVKENTVLIWSIIVLLKRLSKD